LEAGIQKKIEKIDFEDLDFRLMYNSYGFEDLGGFGLAGILLQLLYAY